jgi:L-threonylcarbamoyladenylate synthase
MTTMGTDIELAAHYLRLGQLVAIPTETVYGLAANAFDSHAVLEIYKAKNRPQFNPLIIHTDNLQKLESWGLLLPEKMRLIAAKHSPGPITYVIPKSNHIPDVVAAGTDAVAVRIPQHALTLQLLASLDFPLAAPSANPSTYVSPTTAQHVHEQLGHKISYILDGGACGVGVESTIISFVEPTPTILRYGGLAVEELEKIIGPISKMVAEVDEQPIAPGRIAKHYATRIPLLMGNPDDFIHKYPSEKIGVLSFSKVYSAIPLINQYVLSPSRNLDEAARMLFSAMRCLDKSNIDIIVAEVFPDEGLGKAINDRLKRASYNE